MASRLKEFLKVLTIFLTFLDIAVGWIKFYQMYVEITGTPYSEESKTPTSQEAPCENPDTYWYLSVVFECIGTVLAVFEIFCLGLEIKEDNTLHQKCFGKTFILIVLIYILSAIPSAILEILYRDTCVCSGTFSLTAWKHGVRDITKGVLRGATVMLLQILFHLTEIYTRLRRLGQVIAMTFWCCSFAPDKNETKEKLCEGTMPCFIMSMLLACSYIAVFVTECMYIFCEPK